MDFEVIVDAPPDFTIQALQEPIVQATVAPAPAISVVLQQGPAGQNGRDGIGGAPPSLLLQEMLNINYESDYKEYTYTAGVLTQIDVWDSAAKTVHLFVKTLTYTLGILTRELITDAISNATLRRDFTYVGGRIATETRTYTP